MAERWIWLAAAVAAGVLVAAFWYGRREEQVPGRLAAAILRAAAIALIAGGLFLPALFGRTDGAATSVILLDRSLSMALPARAPLDARTTRASDSLQASRETPSRMDSALALLGARAGGRMRGANDGGVGTDDVSEWLGSDPVVLTFGDAVALFPSDSLAAVDADAMESRLADALEAADARGADRVLVVSDGEWDDPAAARRTASRLGLDIREARVAAPAARLGIAAVDLPRRVRAGETARVLVGIVASGPPEALPERVRVELRAGDADEGADGAAGGGTILDSATVAAPDPGRRARVVLELVAAPPGGDSEWRRIAVALGDGAASAAASADGAAAAAAPADGAAAAGRADPYGRADRWAGWTEVVREAGGAVLVSTRPTWEPKFLLPVLRRSVVGGARAYVRIGDANWIRLGAPPAAMESPGAIARAAEAADLLIVHGSPADLPGWIGSALAEHDRVLVLATAPGELPGTPIRVGQPLPGEWYPAGDPPSSPVAGLLAGIPFDDLPPLAGLFAADGPSDWTPLLARRGREGEGRPVALAGESGRRRWVVLLGTGTWRWGFREGPARQLYDALLGGVVGWLMEAEPGPPVALADSRPAAGGPIRFRVAPGVTDLELSLTDTAGAEVWSDTFAEPDTMVAAPVPESPAGRTLRFVASGARDGDPFRVERPFEVTRTGDEWLPRTAATPLGLAARGSPTGDAAGESSGNDASGSAGNGMAADSSDATGADRIDDAREPRPVRRPVWPFVLAALLLCAEWMWRRHLGLR